MKKPASKLSRRTFIQQGGSALTALSLVSGFPSLLRASASSSIKVGVLAPAHCAVPLYFADLSGYYKEHGITAEIIPFTDMSKIAKGVLQGDLHFGQLIVPMTIAAHTGSGLFAKKNTPLVSPMWLGTNGGSMVVSSRSNIRLPVDLKGKRIGIHSRYLFHYLIIIELLERYGISPSQDVTLKIIELEDMIKALEAEEIDAFINPEPLSSAAVDKGVARNFLLTKDLWFRHPCCCLTSRRTLHEKEPTLFHNFVSATLKGSMQLNSPTSRGDKLKMIWDSVPQYKKLPFNVLQNAFVPGRTDFEPFPYLSSAKVVAALMQKNGLIPHTLSIEATVSEIFLADYARSLMETMNAAYIPAANDREEWVTGHLYN